jgi:hypothetical protein
MCPAYIRTILSATKRHNSTSDIYKSARSFYFWRWEGFHSSPLDTPATGGHTAPGDECGEVGGMRTGRGKQRYSDKTSPNTTSSAINPTRVDLGSHPGCCDGKLATNRPMRS